MSAPTLNTKEEGMALANALRNGEVPEHKVAEARAALDDLKQRLSVEEADESEKLQRQNQERLASVSTAMNYLADDPVGKELPVGQVPHATGIYVPFPETHPNILSNQARERGVDIHTGAAPSARFGQGLAHLKDPELKFKMLDAHYRQPLLDAGIAWPENVPVVMMEQQTGKLAYVRPITEDDVAQNGDRSENLGKARLTIVDPEGMELGDMAEFLPILPVVAGQTAASLAAGALLKSPQAALAASSGTSAIIEGLSSPLKDKLLRDYYGVTQEELDQFSDPNEAFTQALWAGGLEYGMGQAMVFGRWLRNQRTKRTLTEDDYDAIVAELDETRRLQADLKANLDETIEDPLMFVEAASKKMDTTSGQSIGVWASNFFKRLRPKSKATVSVSNDVTRLKLARGYRNLANRETGDAAHLGLDENGLVMPLQDVTDFAEEVLAVTRREEGVDAAVANLRDTTDEATRALDDLHNSVSSAHYSDVQDITANQYGRAVVNEELQWAHFKNYLEPNATGTQYGIQLRNSKTSPIRRTLNGLEDEAVENLSKSMGDATQTFVNDLAALRGDTLDIMQVHRLRSNLLRAKRRIANGTDQSGWTEKELDRVIDSLDDTLRSQEWFRVSNNRGVPAVKREALSRMHMAREATDTLNNMARRDTIDEMIETIVEYDMNVGRRSGVRRRFKMKPAQVRETLFEAGNAGALHDIVEMSGHHPALKAALADELEGIYKGMAMNADGTFQRGGYNQFMAQYGDHAEILFGPEQAARITTADDMARAVLKANEVAKKVEDAYRVTFGDAVDPSKLGSAGVVETMMTSSNVTARQARNLMNRLQRIDPRMAQSVRAEFAQWSSRQLQTSPVALKNGNAIRQWLEGSKDKITAIMGPQFYNDMKLIQRMTDLVDLSDAAKGVAEPVQAAWLQVTRSVFGPLSRKQRFMTAANRIMRGRGAEKALELMTDPRQLRQYVQLRQMDPKSLAFWSTVDALGLRAFFEDEGVIPPDLSSLAAKEEAFRNLAQGGPM